MLIPFHGSVLCGASICGYVSGVIIDSAQQAVTALLVQQLGLLAPERIIPLTLITDTDSHPMPLALEPHSFDEQSAFYEPVSAYQLTPTVPPALEPHLLRNGACVVATDGPVGRIGALLLKPESADIMAIILRRGHLWGTRLISIPRVHIQAIHEFEILLTLDRAAVATLPTMHA